MYLFEKKPAAKVSVAKVVVITSAVVLALLGAAALIYKFLKKRCPECDCCDDFDLCDDDFDSCDCCDSEEENEEEKTDDNGIVDAE